MGLRQHLTAATAYLGKLVKKVVTALSVLPWIYDMTAGWLDWSIRLSVNQRWALSGVLLVISTYLVWRDEWLVKTSLAQKRPLYQIKTDAESFSKYLDQWRKLIDKKEDFALAEIKRLTPTGAWGGPAPSRAPSPFWQDFTNDRKVSEWKDYIDELNVSRRELTELEARAPDALSINFTLENSGAYDEKVCVQIEAPERARFMEHPDIDLPKTPDIAHGPANLSFALPRLPASTSPIYRDVLSETGTVVEVELAYMRSGEPVDILPTSILLHLPTPGSLKARIISQGLNPPVEISLPIDPTAL